VVTFIRGDNSGMALFKLEGASADQLMLILGLPLARSKPAAGCYVTISPKDLTDAESAETFKEGGDDSSREPDLFSVCDESTCPA